MHCGEPGAFFQTPMLLIFQNYWLVFLPLVILLRATGNPPQLPIVPLTKKMLSLPHHFLPQIPGARPREAWVSLAYFLEAKLYLPLELGFHVGETSLIFPWCSLCLERISTREAPSSFFDLNSWELTSFPVSTPTISLSSPALVSLFFLIERRRIFFTSFMFTWT